LIDSRRAKCVRGRQNNFFIFVAETFSQFPDRRRFSPSVDPDHTDNHRRLLGDEKRGIPFEQLQQNGFERLGRIFFFFCFNL
jgi:hypothetical protein